MEERRQRLLTQTTFENSEGWLLHTSSSDKSVSERTSGADVTCACGPDTASGKLKCDTADVADMWHASPPPDARATYFLDVVRACIKQVDDFDLERGDVSSGRRSSNVEGRPASLFDGSGASTPQDNGTSNGTQVLLPPLFRVERTASDEGRREEEHVVANGPVGRRQTLVVRDDREVLDYCGVEEGFISSPRHVCGSATLCVDTTPLLSLEHRLERCLFLHTRDWIAWAEMCRSGLDASGQDRYPLLSALPQGFSEIPNDVSHAALLQLLCLVVLLCHSLHSLCAGLEVFVRSFLGELVVHGHGLRAMTERTTSVQPIICLSHTGSTNLYDILSLAEEKESPPKVVSLAMAPSASPVDLEESQDLGHWAVLHVSASEDWVETMLVLLCWFA